MLEPNLYRVQVSSCPDWIEYASCTLGISVGQPYHEGAKFAATVEWAARHFEHIRVDVSDTLQRHRRVGEGASYSEAEASCLGDGDQWIARAKPVLMECGRPYSFVRWNAWLRQAEFLEIFDHYSQLANSDPVLSAAIDLDVEGFLARHIGRGQTLLDVSLARAASRAYLLEELAVITLQGAAGRSARIYPGPQLECFKALRAGKVADASPGLERDYYVEIHFRQRNMMRPAPRAASPAFG